MRQLPTPLATVKLFFVTIGCLQRRLKKQIPLNLPLQRETFHSPLKKGGIENLSTPPPIPLPYCCEATVLHETMESTGELLYFSCDSD